ncbi:adenylate cyclase associated N terminal-domain-containing protein [Lipomyces oligophaga]|uniref:adenylate cyclase associated N terminal-domain-containing protein n=1 Tax=Lipomyces oligophaga TaxID=45792 RepID=UPI0034CD444E
MADLTNVPGYNLVTLMKRLEAATSRLEDLTIFQSQAMQAKSDADGAGKSIEPGASASAVAAPAVNSVATLPEPEPELEPEILPKSIVEFDSFIETSVTPFVKLSREIDPLVAEQAQSLQDAFMAEREFLLTASKSKKPSVTSTEYIDLFKPVSAQVIKIQEIREKNRQSKFATHLSTVSEGVPALGWIGMEPTPVPFIGEMKDSAQFYSNRVMKDYRDVDKIHVEWARGFIAILTDLQAYVKEFHKTGPTWNAKGEDLSKVLAASAPTASVSSASGPPPPPPPPPASVFEVQSTSAPGGGLNAVFSQINQGESVTSGLKKVDKSQMTHKNPSLRAKDIVVTTSTASRGKTPSPPTKPQSLKQKKPARIELEGTKWIVENFENNPEVIVEAEINHGVFIHRCKNSTIQIKGKFNAVTVNECSGTGLLVESLVASADIIKSQKFGLQVTGRLPTISIDQSDDGQIYLSKESLDVDIYTSKSSSINVNIPDEADEGEFKEQPVPEQLLHTVVNGKLTSTIVEHVG